jgi:hypothetical protein
MSWQEILLVGLAVWVLVLSFFLVWIFNNFRRLSRGVEQGNLFKTLDRVLAQQEDVSMSLKEAKKKISEFETEAELHIQKIGVVRFNPFKEMGGDHSFSLALLDGNDTGFVVTGLHTRERTRVYLKSIKKGKSDLELSSEEKKALISAQKS